jgi:fructoselysine transporter
MACIYGNLDQNFNPETQVDLNKSMGSIFISSGLLIPAITFSSSAYSGTEISTYITEEVKQPEKTIPKVIIFGIIAAIIIFLIYGISLLTLTPMSELSNPNNPVPQNLVLMPAWAKIVFQTMSILFFTGSINAYLVYQTALVFKLSEEGDLTHHFKKLTKNNVPYMAMFFLVGLSLIYILTSDIFSLIAYFSLTISALKIVMATSIFYLRKKDPDYKKIWNNKFFYLLVFFAYFTCTLTFVGGIMALFMRSDQPVLNLISQIAFLIGMFGLIPIGYLKYYIQNLLTVKKAIRQELDLKTNRELRNEYQNDRQTYLRIKQENKVKVNEEYKKYLIEKRENKRS